MNSLSSIKLICLSICALVISNACKKGESDKPFIPDPNNSGNSAPITASIQGVVLDENNIPLPGTNIEIGGSYSTRTDAKGSFRFNNITLDRFTSVVSADAVGYFKGYRTFAASNKGLNFVKIQLLKKTFTGTINGSTGGSISTSNYTITFPANAIVNKNTGAAYTGSVSVFAHYISPLAANLPAIVPGNMVGVDSSANRVILQSMGMIAVEILGSGSEPLQIAPGKNASLKFEIPSIYITKAPATIPLWYIDEQSGLWKQEGVAIKNGSAYTGSVKHFSFWNVDIPTQDLVYLEMNIKNLQGQPLPHALVEIRQDSISGWGSPSFGYTDSTGYVGGLVPANEPLLLNIKNECYSVAYSKIIGPFSQNTNIGSISANTSSSEVNIAGTVKNCAGQVVTNGWVDIFLDNKSYKTNVNSSGGFAITLLKCNNNIGAIANDIAAGKSGIPQTFTIGVDNVSQLVLTACDVPLKIYNVTTLAGSDSGFVDATGSSAKFYFPEDVAIDANGNVIVADLANNRIRKITPAGVVTTLAGSDRGYVNATGAAAKFYFPKGVAVDGAGNIVVADQGNSRIRKISPAGVVTTFAGDGSFGFADGTGANAKFFGPSGVDVDASGNIIVADYGNHRIRKISPAGVVTTIAGSGTSGFADGIGTSALFAGGSWVDTDTSGNIFVAEYNNNRVRKISPTFVVTTIAGGTISGATDGIGTSAKFFGPNGIGVEGNGNIYISDRNNSRIRKLTPQ